MFSPVPLFEELSGPGISISLTFRVESAAWIAIPMPGTTSPRAPFKYRGAKTHLAQSVSLINPANTRSDDDRIVMRAKTCQCCQSHSPDKKSRKNKGVGEDRCGAQSIIFRHETR